MWGELLPWAPSRSRKCSVKGSWGSVLFHHWATVYDSSSETRGHPHSTSSPSKRIFSMPPPKKAPLNTPGTPVLEDFPQNDDEKERLQRRRSRALDLQFSTDSPRLLASPSSRWAPWAGPVPWPGVPGSGTPALPRGFWVLNLKLQCQESLPECLVLVFHLGMLIFQLRFLNLQTHRLQSITPPVSNYPLKMWVSAGLSVRVLQLKHRKIEPSCFCRECVIDENCVLLLSLLFLMLVFSVWFHCFR